MREWACVMTDTESTATQRARAGQEGGKGERLWQVLSEHRYAGETGARLEKRSSGCESKVFRKFLSREAHLQVCTKVLRVQQDLMLECDEIEHRSSINVCPPTTCGPPSLARRIRPPPQKL